MSDQDDQKRLIKEAFKEGVKEWLDEKYQLVGKWTIRGFLALLLAALVMLILWSNGHLSVSLITPQTPPTIQ